MDPSEAYQRYLQSPHWAGLRAQAKELGYRCIISGSEDFTLHHLNYRNLGAERFWEDLVPLAWEHHEAFHVWAKQHSRKNHHLLAWIDEMGHRIDPDIRRRLEAAQSYNRRLAKRQVSPRQGAWNIFTDEPRKWKVKRKRKHRGGKKRRRASHKPTVREAIRHVMGTTPTSGSMTLSRRAMGWILDHSTPDMMRAIGGVGDSAQALRASLIDRSITAGTLERLADLAESDRSVQFTP